MKQIPLTKNKFALVDDEDYAKLSKLTWRAHHAYGDLWYAIESKHDHRMHRMIMGVTDPAIFVDHIDHDGLDNRKEKLRLVTNTTNQLNRRSAASTSTTGYRGVSPDKRTGKFRARITLSGVRKHLGQFDTPEEASSAFHKALETVSLD